MLFRLCAVVMLMAFTAACAGTSTDSSVADQPQNSLAQTKTADCRDARGISEMRAEYAANRLRAEETYVGQRLCLRGTILEFFRNGRGYRVWAAVDEASFTVHLNEWENWVAKNLAASDSVDIYSSWQEWILTSNVGDAVEAECKVRGFTTKKGSPNRPAGVPLFEDCLRMVAGTLWVAPTLTPAPTPTPLPCTATRLSDRYYNGDRWLNIDCPSGEVTVGIVDHRDDSDKFQSLSRGDSAMVSFLFRDLDEAQGFFSQERGWKQWLEEPQGVEGVSLIWEAPPDIAAAIISKWRRGIAEELVVLVGGGCCNLDLSFDLPQSPAPVRQWQPAAVTAVPSPTPATTPTPAPRPTHTPTPTLAPTPRPTLPDQSPLTAEFRDVPASHNGRDAIQFQLLFTEPVSVSYKTLRDVAIQAENGTVLESKRVDKRSDLWLVTVEPEGDRNVVISLTGPVDCADAAAVCTKGGKALANSPTVSVRYGQ